MSHESIQFVCPACGETYLVTPQAVGHRMRCQHCNEVVEVKPAATLERRDYQQTRELTEEEAQGEADPEMIEPVAQDSEVEAPPFVLEEPEEL